MPLQTIQLTLHQQVLLTLAVEEQVTDLSNRANNPDLTDLSTNAFLEDYRSAWKDGETLFMPCSSWRDAAENVAESLTKGTRVIVQGRLVQRSYTTREGENRTVVEMQVDEIGPSLRYAKAQVTRQPRGGGQGGYNGGGGIGQGQSGYNAPAGGAADDPWATGGSTAIGDEPPF